MSPGCYSTIHKLLLGSQSICLPPRYCGRLRWSLAQILASDQLVPTVTSLSSETVHLIFAKPATYDSDACSTVGAAPLFESAITCNA
jgi:hypothetical protein